MPTALKVYVFIDFSPAKLQQNQLLHTIPTDFLQKFSLAPKIRSILRTKKLPLKYKMART